MLICQCTVNLQFSHGYLLLVFVLGKIPKYVYRKTSNKHPWHLLEHGLQNPRNLLEIGVYLRPGI